MQLNNLKTRKNTNAKISAFLNDEATIILQYLPVKFSIILKSSELFNSSFCIFLFTNKSLKHNNIKTRTAMSARISVFVICIEAIIYFLLCKFHHCTFKSTALILIHLQMRKSLYTFVEIQLQSVKCTEVTRIRKKFWVTFQLHPSGQGIQKDDSVYI